MRGKYCGNKRQYGAVLHLFPSPPISTTNHSRACLYMSQQSPSSLSMHARAFPPTHSFHPLLNRPGSDGPPMCRVSHAVSSRAVARRRPLAGTGATHADTLADAASRPSGSTGLLRNSVGHSTRPTADAPSGLKGRVPSSGAKRHPGSLIRLPPRAESLMPQCCADL